MAKSFVFAKNNLSNGLKGCLISRALVHGCSILGDRGTPLPPSKDQYQYIFILMVEILLIKINYTKNHHLCYNGKQKRNLRR